MESDLVRLKRWARHGTLRQFMTEISYKIAKDGYSTELEGDKIICYSVTREGGFLGIGGHKVKTPVLDLTRVEDSVEIDLDRTDPEFVKMLLGKLKAH